MSTATRAASEARDLDGLLVELGRYEEVVAGWDPTQQRAVQGLREAIEALHREALARLIRTLKTDPAAAAQLQRAATDEVVYAVLRRHGIVRPALQERIEGALEEVRPMLAEHGGGVELVGLPAPDTVEVRLLGSCDGCPASVLTLTAGVEKAIRAACPEITTIRKIDGPGLGRDNDFISPFARAEVEGWTDALALEDLAEGELKTLAVSGRELLMRRLGDEITCYDNACAHLGMPLDQGLVEDDTLVCPHHAFRYALDTGECLTVPTIQLGAHGVRVRGTRVEVRLER